LTVSELAKQVNLSASAVTRTFREMTGSSPYQLVKSMRLERARDILIEQHLSVADVSAAVGYTSTSHFIKEFRGRFGATPRGYFDSRSVCGLHRERVDDRRHATPHNLADCDSETTGAHQLHHAAATSGAPSPSISYAARRALQGNMRQRDDRYKPTSPPASP